MKLINLILIYKKNYEKNTMKGDKFQYGATQDNQNLHRGKSGKLSKN